MVPLSGQSHTKLEQFVGLARAGRPRAWASVERLKAACQLEAPHFDAELVELISHVVVRTETPPQSIVRIGDPEKAILEFSRSASLRREFR